MQKAAQAAGVVTGVAGTVTGIIDSITGFLSGAGVSGLGAGSTATSTVDGIIGEGDSGYTTGKATSRATLTDIKDMRSGTSPDQPTGQKYSTQISPQGRIGGGKYGIKGEEDNLDIYPPDLGKYYMRLDFMDYERPAPFTASTVLTEYSVALPVPAGLVEYYDNKWDTPDLGVIGDIADAFTRKDGSLYDTVASTTGAGIRRAIGSVSDAAGVAISQGLGSIPNPNVTAAFRGPNLRQFSFSWTFAPKTEAESKKIQAIVRRIKKRILPVMNSGTTSLLGYPSLIQPLLFPKVTAMGDDGKESVGHLFEFKKCAMPRMNVSYSPTGIPTFFKGTNLPTFVQLSITLVEIEYWTAEDNDQVVGSENKLAGAEEKLRADVPGS